MSIRGSNFENQHPFASDHALVWAHCMPDGLLYGVDMSFTSTLFTLGTGFMLVAGRMFEITTAENISISPGNGYARVYATIDTGGTASENSFDQVSFGVDYAANLDSFPELTQGEININQGAAVYQTEVAVLAINNTGVTTIERQMELVDAGAGGGSGSAFAAISVSYPPGSICTCTDGIKPFAAKDTSGQALFIIPYAATWTVTATDGTNTKSQSVEITTEGQIVNVALSYALILFDSGAVVPWKVIQANPNASVGDTIYLKASDPETPVVSAVRTTNKIDVSSYSSLKYIVTAITGTNNSFMCVTSSTAAPISAGLSNAVTSNVVAYGKPNSTGTYEVDVSKVTGSYYVSPAVGHYTVSGLTISKVWLE